MADQDALLAAVAKLPGLIAKIDDLGETVFQVSRAGADDTARSQVRAGFRGLRRELLAVLDQIGEAAQPQEEPDVQ